MGEPLIIIGQGNFADTGCQFWDRCQECPLPQCADEWRVSPRAYRATADMAEQARPLIKVHPEGVGITLYLRLVRNLMLWHKLIYPRRGKSKKLRSRTG